MGKNTLEIPRNKIETITNDTIRRYEIIEKNKFFQSDINAIKSEILTLQKHVNKNNRILSFIVLFSVVIVGTFFVFNIIEAKGSTDVISTIKSKHFIENLKGDTIDTWISWKLVEDEPLHVNIVNSAEIPHEIVEKSLHAILSEDAILLDDSFLDKGPKGSYSTYYRGWGGALKSISTTETKFVIPGKFEIIESSHGTGDIIITLTHLKDTDGLTGSTNSIVDESQNQILKSNITIYEADKLSSDQLATIIRHEMGHALGLLHSNAPEDLMAPTIQTEFPYISPCDVDAIISLYDDQSTSKVVCEK